MVHFLCPACKTTLHAPDDKAGKKTACPQCGRLIVIPPAPIPTLAIDLDAAVEQRLRHSRRSERRHDEPDSDHPHFTCPFCKTHEAPIIRQKISTGGWIVFILLLLVFCWPLFWIGLLMKDEYRVCYNCGMKLS
jgi:DNA-directed RNA polymerase subunit M/transcription elongation factor TFIIS